MSAIIQPHRPCRDAMCNVCRGDTHIIGPNPDVIEAALGRIEQIRQWEAGMLHPDHDTFSFGHGFGTALVEAFDGLTAYLDAVKAAR